MLVYVIQPDNQNFQEIAKRVDLFELRIDLLGVKRALFLKEKLPLPTILTCRRKRDGGSYEKSEEERVLLLETLLREGFDYVDLESDLDPLFHKRVENLFPSTKIILSHHDLEKTPDLELLFQSMKKKRASIYKIATFAASSIDLLRSMCFLLRHAKEGLSVISLGEYGEPSRVLGKVLGSQLGYTSNAPLHSQISLQDLEGIYSYANLNHDTKIYALLGDPIDKSPGHVFHNAFFKKHGMNNLYIKIRLKEEELEEFFHLTKNLPFYGFSVTMPLKEAIMPYLSTLSTLSKNTHSVNTLYREGRSWAGDSTDGGGLMTAIKKRISVEDKRVLLLGAGGSARSIAYEVIQEKGDLSIGNRSYERAKILADELGCRAFALQDLDKKVEEGFDLLINTLPVDIAIDRKGLSKGSIYVDIDHNPKRKGSTLAKEIGLMVITGKEMYEEQAYLQQELWGYKELLAIDG